jgi:oxygen-independent coproporphyrinogen-3 oxidase
MAVPEHRVSLETLQRFDRPGPRYTSYPTAVEFHEGVDQEAYRTRLGLAGERGATDPISLYVHLPFCRHRCQFCACHVVVTPRPEVAATYLAYVKREIDMVAELLGPRRDVIQMHWGGGTPTYFSPAQLAELHGHVRGRFRLDPGAEIAIEVDPRVTTFEHLDACAGLGFNRLSLGVQDFTDEVQAAIGRDQTFEETRALAERARAVGFDEGLNVDLIYGLPRQTVPGFEAGLERVLDLRPDRLAVYSFAYVPWAKAHQRRLEPADLPAPEVKLELYLTALNRLADGGYEPIGMDHFALPDDELAVAAREGRLARNFMGYTVKPASAMVACGVSGIGDLEAGYFQNEKKLSRYYEALDAGRLPVERGYLLDDDDLVRRYVITQLMCNFRVSKPAVAERFGIDFDSYFAQPLQRLDELVRAGFVRLEDDAVTITGAGRLFVRNAAMAFDRYLETKAKTRPTFSRTI